MSKEVKPCPFCGGEDIRYEKDDVIAIYCYECDCQSMKCETFEEAIEAWNRREATEKIVERLERELKSTEYTTICEPRMRRGYDLGIKRAIEIVKLGGKV